MKTAQDVANRTWRFMGAFAVSAGMALAALAIEPTAYLSGQMGDSWGYVISDVGVTIVEHLGGEGEMQLYNSSDYRREVEIPAVIDSRPVVSIEKEYGELIDCRPLERCSILTVPASITNITGRLDRNDPDCIYRGAGEMYSVEGLRFLGDVPKFPKLNLQDAESFPFSTASKIYVPRQFAESWSAFLAQLGMSVAGYVNEDTDRLGVTMRTKNDDGVWTYQIGSGNRAILCRWNEVNFSGRSRQDGVMYLSEPWTNTVGQVRGRHIRSEATVMPVPSGTLSIPSQLDGRRVVSVGPNAFRDFGQIEDVIVPPLEEIGSGAFAHCKALRAFDFESVHVIADAAFANCTNLRSVAFSTNLTSVGKYAFSGCRGLTNLTFATDRIGRTEILNGAFALCSDLPDLYLPKSVGQIGRYAFTCCESLTNLVIDADADLSDGAFSGCVALSNVEWKGMPSSVGDDAFGDCILLREVVIPPSVTNVGHCAFSRCSSLSALSIDGCAAVGSFAFDDCAALSDVSWKKGRGALGRGAFCGCRTLRRVDVPHGLERIEEFAFDGCAALSTIVFPEGLKTVEPCFADCRKLSSVYFRGDVPATTESLFDGGSSNAVLYVNTAFPNWGSIPAKWNGRNVEPWQDYPTVLDRLVVLFDLRSFGENVGEAPLCQRVTNVCDLVAPVVHPKQDGAFGGWRLSYGHADEVVKLYAVYFDAMGEEIAEYYVSESGDDANSGRTREQSFRTIGRALEAAEDGSLVLVGPGEYVGIDYHPLRKHVEIRSEQGCEMTRISGGYTNRCVRLFADPYDDDDVSGRGCTIVFEGFTICNGRVRDDWRFENCGAGVMGGLYVNCVISNCVVQSSSSESAILGAGAYGATLINSVVANNALLDSSGLYPKSDASAFGGTGACDCELFNCTVSGNGMGGVSPSDEGIAQLSFCRAYNTIIESLTSLSSSSIATSLNSCFIGDPRFAKNGAVPYQLADSSPCVDAGDNQFLISVEAFGKGERLVGRSVDIGACEVQPDVSMYTFGQRDDGTLAIVDVAMSISGDVSLPVRVDGKLVTAIGPSSFADCGLLTGLTIPDAVTDVGVSAFAGCTNLVRMTFRGNAPVIGGQAFENVPTTCKVFVAKGSTGWDVEIPGTWNGMRIYWIGDAAAEDAIPDLGDSPDREAVAKVLAAVEDSGVRSNVDESNYVDFRSWAGRVKARGASAAAGFAAVQASPLAWLSYAVASDTLIDKTPTDRQIKVEKFVPGATSGAFDFVVGIEDISVGDDATAENLAKVFGIEGGTSLQPEAFSSENVSLVFEAPENGKVRFTAGPKDASQGTFFMRVKLTP